MPNEEFDASKYPVGARHGWEARQPEIDALDLALRDRTERWQKLLEQVAELKHERRALKAEVEKLRKEHLRLTDLTSYAMKETKPVECCPTCKHEKFHYKAAHIPDCYTRICDHCGYTWKEAK